jgi:hypothetical protein
MRTVFIVEKLADPDGFRRWRIMAISDVPEGISSAHVVELLGSCRRLTDRLDYSLRELAFGDEVLI